MDQETTAELTPLNDGVELTVAQKEVLRLLGKAGTTLYQNTQHRLKGQGKYYLRLPSGERKTVYPSTYTAIKPYLKNGEIGEAGKRKLLAIGA